MTEKRINDNKTKTTALAEQVILTFSVIGTLFTLGWVLCYSRYGLDLTDESFYLVWISDPFNYRASVTQFGFIYHPLYELLDGNIAALRQANILINFCLAWVLCNVYLKTVFETQALDTVRRLIISAALATTSLLLFSHWLTTPSYNSLALQALLITANGLLLADKIISRTSITGWLLIGIGGWLAFMAKPATAAALSMFVGVYLLLGGKLHTRFLVISLVTAIGLLVISALTIDGSISIFIERLKGGMENIKTLGSGHTISQILRLDTFHLNYNEKILLVASSVLIASSAYLSYVQNHVGTMLSVLFALLTLGMIFGFNQKPLYASFFQGILIWSAPFAFIMIEMVVCRIKGLLQITLPQWAVAFIFLVFPYVYAFGSNINYWYVGAHAGIFWVLAGLVVLSPIVPDRKFPVLLLSLGLAVQLITVSLVQTAIQSPYRQPQPLHDNNYKLEIGKPGSSLVLSKGFGQYFVEAIDVAKQAGFKKGTPMIDLTGQSPGILYALGAINIGQAWTIGGYPGSDARAVAMLKKVACEELATTWLLAEPDGPRKISSEILLSFGANMATDFEIVGTFKTAEGASGYREARIQQLLRPVRSIDAGMRACDAGRVSK